MFRLWILIKRSKGRNTGLMFHLVIFNKMSKGRMFHCGILIKKERRSEQKTDVSSGDSH